MKKAFIILFLAMASVAFSWEIKPGTYRMNGSSSTGQTYEGQVVITPQGHNYIVTWYIGSTQMQTGIGIHRSWEDVFSVAFTDLSKNLWGVCSYKLNAWGDLEGYWTGSQGTGQGVEVLKWTGY